MKRVGWYSVLVGVVLLIIAGLLWFTGARMVSAPTVEMGGVTGRVMIGPTCPVVREPPDPTCADKPYATAIIVYATGMKTPYLIANSDTKGIFRFDLPIGSYILQAGNGSALPHCAPVDIEVSAGTYGSTTISCDSGIR